MQVKGKITIKKVLDQASEHIDERGREQIMKAYDLAREGHKGQRRKTGEPFITHPLIVAYYVAFAGLGTNSISAALLHDVVEDTPMTLDDIKKKVNPTVAKLVDGVTKLRHTHFTSKYEQELESIRKFIIAAAKDVRVLIIKLADRLHNAQTIKGLSKERQETYAKEIETIFVPLAEYIGIHAFKRDLENAAFKALHPQRYKQIKAYLHDHHKDHERYVKQYEEQVKKTLEDQEFTRYTLESRAKNIASIDRKIQKYLSEQKAKSEDDFWSIYDYYALRIICNSKRDCYRALSIVQDLWEPIPGEFDDYIAKPKPNGYKSIHSTLKTKENKIIEVQIRTHKMHHDNEFGPASHIAYKLSGRRNPEASNMFDWVAHLFRWKNGKELHAKDYEIDIFKKNIFVLTPTQEVKELVKDATPVDFAYAVHTQIGNSCRGAKVNGKIVPLDTKLQTGDVVEIITEKTAKYPVKDWLKFVKSSGTKSHINRALREKEEETAIIDGENKFRAIMKKNRRNDEDMNQKILENVLRKYSVKTEKELFAKIGFNIISAESVYDSIFPSRGVKRKKKFYEKKGGTSSISIEGSKDSLYSLAKCCNPKPTDDIVALTTVMKGIRIHKSSCPNLAKYAHERHLHAEWM